MCVYNIYIYNQIKNGNYIRKPWASLAPSEMYFEILKCYIEH